MNWGYDVCLFIEPISFPTCRCECQTHSNGCFLLTFYFPLTFIKTSGSLEWGICDGNKMWMLIVRNVHSARFRTAAAALGRPHLLNAGVPIPSVDASAPSDYVHKSGSCLSSKLFIVFCFSKVTSRHFPSHPLLMWFRRHLITLLTDTCLKSRLRKQLEIQSGICFELGLWTVMCRSLWKGEVIINITFGIHHSDVTEHSAVREPARLAFRMSSQLKEAPLSHVLLTDHILLMSTCWAGWLGCYVIHVA